MYHVHWTYNIRFFTFPTLSKRVSAYNTGSLFSFIGKIAIVFDTRCHELS